MSPQYQYAAALMHNMRQLANFNNQGQHSGNFFESKPTTSTTSMGAGGPMNTPKRKKVERESKKDSHIVSHQEVLLFTQMQI